MNKMEQHTFEQIPSLQALLDNIPHPVYCQDVYGFYLGHNKAFHDFFYRDAHENYVGKTIFELPIKLEEAVAFHKADLEVFRSPGTQIQESTFTLPDGSTRQITTKKTTFFMADGSIGGIVAFMTDTKEFRLAEESLRENETRFKDLSEASLEPVAFIENGIIMDINHRIQEMFGYDEDEVIGRNILDFFAPDARAITQEKIDLNNEATYETMGMKKDGTVFPLKVYPRQLRLKGKRISISVMRDLTEQKKMEEEVLMSKNLQSVGTLADGIAHDFNNLLMTIVGNISLAKINVPKDSKAIGYLSEAERMVFLGKNLTHQLLTFSRKIDTVRKILNINPIIREITEKVFEGSAIRLNYELPVDLAPIEGDEDQIRQVIQNILVNAKEAMPSGGSLHITCENVNIAPQLGLPLTKEEYIRILIHDEGVGIPEKDLSKIFDPYFTTKEMGSKKGVGLGLAICYSIVKKHNGYILVDSAPGEGTTFQIYLPVYKQEITVKPGERKTTRRSNGKILVMDDEEMVLKIAGELLRHMGYEVTKAQTGEEAIWLYRQALELGKPFDAVILDLSIPDGIGGKEVLEELIAIYPSVKAIISSGYLNDPVVMDYESYGFTDMLTKPYNPEELYRKLHNIIHPREES